MIDADVKIAKDVLEAVAGSMKTAPVRMRREMGMIARGPIAQAMVRELIVVGKIKLPFIWKTEKQRRWYFANHKSTYKRSGKLQRAWTVTLNEIQGRGSFALKNDAKANGKFYADFVQGKWQQPGHKATGWKNKSTVLRKYAPRFQEAVVLAWRRVNKVRNG